MLTYGRFIRVLPGYVESASSVLCLIITGDLLHAGQSVFSFFERHLNADKAMGRQSRRNRLISKRVGPHMLRRRRSPELPNGRLSTTGLHIFERMFEWVGRDRRCALKWTA
jgi:hypothetical protein